MRPVLVAALLAACASPREAEPEPAAVAEAPDKPRVILPEPRDEPPLNAWRLAMRLKGVRLGAEVWPRRWELPKPEERYDAANLWFGGYGCAECWDVLVDLDDPRIFWLRFTGGIAGIREYMGPAEILGSDPLVIRVGER